VRNARFEKLADEERERHAARRENAGPPPVTNSRFAAAAYQRPRDDDGPPPVANSRFAAAAEADRSYQRDDRERGPPPVANSRFAAAAEADGAGRPAFDQGPPPVANSRFAAAAAMADEENLEREERRRDRDNFYNRGDDRPPAMPQNSRFAAAAAMDEDYVDREERDRRMHEDRDRFDERSGGGGRFGGGDNYRDDNYRGGGGGGGGGFGGYDGGRNEYDEPPRPSRVDELLKPKKPALEENVLKPPTKEHEANMFKIPVSVKQEENFLAPPTKKPETSNADPAIVVAHEMEETDVPIAAISAEATEELLNEFVGGDKLGGDLKTWVEEKRPLLPTVEKLIFHLLTEREKLNPDPDCAWADSSNFGAALAVLVEDDLVNQMQVLWGIQKYCDSLGFPKLDGESVVQSMFRAMYKYDLVLDDAFLEWKEDESDAHEKGKMNAIIQTVDWFNWLEEDDEEEEEEEEEEVEE